MNLIPIVPNALVVSTEEAKDYRFITFGRKGWMEAIAGQQANPATSPLPNQPVTVAGPAGPKGVSVLGIISLVFGVIGLPISLIPCLNVLTLPLVGIGLLVGLIGYFVSKSGPARAFPSPARLST